MRLRLLPIVDFSGELADRPILSGGVGPSGRIAVLTGSVTKGQSYQPSVPGFEPEPTLLATDVLLADPGSGPIRVLSLEPTVVRYPIIQPLPDSSLLVVSSRVRVRDGPNAVVFDDGGGLTRTASFGDGIEHVLVDQRNRAWVGYFDEGVFGNLGWSGPDGPTRGLVRFDLASGEADLSFVPRDGLRPIDDCYALNIAEDAVWACYYSKFDLVRIGSDGAMRRWTTGSSGARALVTDGARTLLVGQYGDPWKATLWTNGTDALGNPRHVRLELSDGTTPTSRFFGRGDRIVVSDGPRWYAASLSDLTAFDGSEQDSVAEQSTPADHIPHRHF